MFIKRYKVTNTGTNEKKTISPKRRTSGQPDVYTERRKYPFRQVTILQKSILRCDNFHYSDI